jgi:hypothetical protein
MVSYPTEGSKGRYFAWFWAIFNLGGVLGSLVSLTDYHYDFSDFIFTLPINDRPVKYQHYAALTLVV